MKKRLTRAAQIKALAGTKKRDKKRKLKRLKLAEDRAKVLAAFNPTRSHANIMAIRVPGHPGPEGEPHLGEVVFGVRTGQYGHPTTTVLRIEAERIAGAVEDGSELGEVVTQLGLLTLAALLRFNLAEGPDELARRFAKWAGIDLSKLKKEAEQEAAAEPGTTAVVDEDGDIEVRTVPDVGPDDGEPFAYSPDYELGGEG